MEELHTGQVPLVTVGIPVFNGENNIARVTELILDQDYTNIEILFSDNCSSDNSNVIIHELSLRNKNIRLIRSKVNLGALANINSLFENAQGKYMLIASLDDSWSRDFITNSVKIMQNSPNASLCIPRVNMCIGPKKTIIYSIRLRKDYFFGHEFCRFWRTLTSFPSAGWYGLYRVSAVRKIGPIPISFAGDLIFLQKLSLVSNFIYCDTAILTFEVYEKWNSRESDLSFFYGDAEKPSLRLPFLIVLKTQYLSILSMKLPWFLKFGALAQILLDFTIKKTLVLTILAIKSSPIAKKSKMWSLLKLHQFFNQPSWVIIENQDAYLKKEVCERYGIK